jgi:hypothetical protein
MYKLLIAVLMAFITSPTFASPAFLLASQSKDNSDPLNPLQLVNWVVTLQ